MATYGPYMARVVSVHDGDTFTATVTLPPFDFGFHVITTQSATQKFRLDGCNAAPLGTPSGDGAAVALRALLAPGVDLTLLSVGAYKYGDEWMARVKLPDGSDVTSIMIAQQWAAPWTGIGSQPLPPWPRTVDGSTG